MERSPHVQPSEPQRRVSSLWILRRIGPSGRGAQDRWPTEERRGSEPRGHARAIGQSVRHGGIAMNEGKALGQFGADRQEQTGRRDDHPAPPRAGGADPTPGETKKEREVDDQVGSKVDRFAGIVFSTGSMLCGARMSPSSKAVQTMRPAERVTSSAPREARPPVPAAWCGHLRVVLFNGLDAHPPISGTVSRSQGMGNKEGGVQGARFFWLRRMILTQSRLASHPNPGASRGGHGGGPAPV